MTASLFSSIVHAQTGTDHLAVFVTGGMNGSKFSVPYGPNPLKGLTVERKLQPGFEVVLRPQSRLSLGVGISVVDFPKKTERFALKDEFEYTGPDGTRGKIVMPGTEFVGTDVSNTAKMTALTGMAYFNLLRESRVRPFIGGGGGVGFTKNRIETRGFYHPIFQQYFPNFKLELPEDSTERSRLGILKIVGGMDSYPIKHLVIRVSGGYLNGGYGAVGVGFGF